MFFTAAQENKPSRGDLVLHRLLNVRATKNGNVIEKWFVFMFKQTADLYSESTWSSGLQINKIIKQGLQEPEPSHR